MNTDDVNSEGYGSSFGSPTLFRLTGVDTRLGDFFLEECLAGVLLRNGERERERRSGGGVPLVTVLEKEGGFDEPPGAHEPPAPARGGSLLFCLNPGDGWDCGGKGPGFPSDDDVLQKLEEYIASRSPSVGGENEQNQPSDGTATTFLRNPSVAAITVVDDESAEDDTDDRNVEYITEEEAYRLWLLDQQERQQAEEQAAEEPTAATGGRVAVSRLVSSPDGELVVPRHASRGRGCGEPQSDRNGSSGEGKPSTAPGLSPATVRQLERDPGLLEFDNVPRVHYAEVVQHLRKASKSNGGTNNDGGCEALRGFGTRPVVVRGFRTGPEAEPGPLGRDLVSFRERLRATLLDKGAETVVRTGNRETLVENGFHNSRASLLGGVGVVEEALRGLAGDKGKSNGSGDGPTPDPDPTIVFNPIHELPPEFRAGDVLGLWLNHGGTRSPAGATPGGGGGGGDHTNSGDAPEPRQRIFPNALWHLVLDEANANASGNKDSDGGGNKDDGSGSSIKFTLCMANEGFGIGMHKHGPALFFLTEGRKKWYLSHPDPIDRLLSCGEGGKTHPGFYRELSTHKCIQEPGELLLVPNLWYHEIYNLSPGPTIGIQALGGERPVPGDL